MSSKQIDTAESIAVKEYNIWWIIMASSAGTLIEWYDFYIFGSLATIIDTQFFPKENETAALLATLAIFATGFVVRPFGALFFGRLGDKVGRKFTFMLTLMLMGGATFAIGLLPGYATIGVFAPLLMLLLRLLQGLALGGEYGGAATYVAEHSPDKKRGFYTSWIQTTATLGLFVSLGVILATRLSIGEDAFKAWGWRIPFLLSIVLIAISYFVRRRMQESPMFARLKSSGRASVNPIKESFGNWFNLKFVLLALFGATAGQGVIWYTGQFYALFYIQKVLNVEMVLATQIISTALILGTPGFILFGWLSDKIGRKWIMMVGCFLAITTYYPIYKTMIQQSGFTSEYISGSVNKLQAKAADFKAQAAQLEIVQPGQQAKPEDVKKAGEMKKSAASIETGLPAAMKGEFNPQVSEALKVSKALPPVNTGMMIFLVLIQVIYVTMVYGPIAAFLVELFPTKIRYTSMSLPYHIGNGVFGGLLPLIGTAMVATTNNPLAGLWYPMGVAVVTLVIGSIFIKDTRDVKLWDEMEHLRQEGKAL